ncbi:MAG TPA: CheR family methyltransferase [Burkholderiaceae bacterium]|nr:CheR family methyltransferase [Burkholderiaceae bacterium]
MKPAPLNKLDTNKEFEFTARDFERARNLIHQHAGIALAASKQEMVYSRLARRLRATGINTFSDYLDQLERGGEEDEREAFVNALTTNLTSFFREAHHFPIFAEHVRQLREPAAIWCCASSTGEEPYSIAMTLCETYATLTPPAHILATDIDTNVLAVAARGVYPIERLDKLSAERKKRFFLRGTGAQSGLARVRPELSKLITFRPLNLLAGSWPITTTFDIIFCRNVMIYFDKTTQTKILSRFAPLMKPHGLLFAGHSENFSYVSGAFKLRAKTVYEVVPSHSAKASARKPELDLQP